MCFALGFYEALLGLLNPADQFIISLGKFHDCFLWTTQFYAFILYRPCIFPFPSFPTSLLSYYFWTKAAETSHKNVFQMKTIGMEPSQTSQARWKRQHNTFTPSLASSPGHSRILSHNRGEKSGEGLVPILRHGPEMVDSILTYCGLDFIMMATCPRNVRPVQQAIEQ